MCATKHSAIRLEQAGGADKAARAHWRFEIEILEPTQHQVGAGVFVVEGEPSLLRSVIEVWFPCCAGTAVGPMKWLDGLTRGSFNDAQGELGFNRRRDMKHLRKLQWSMAPLVVGVIAMPVVEVCSILVPDLLSRGEQLLLLILGLVATDLLIERVRSSPPPRFITDLGPFNEYTEGAREILVAGGSLDLLVGRWSDYLARKARAGCKVRLVLMDPNSGAMSCVERWAGKDLPAGLFRDAICNSLKRLARLDFGGNLEVKLNRSIPAVSVLIVDGSKPNGRMRVNLQPFQCAPDERPTFELRRQGEDERWYELFYQQYVIRLWQDAEEVDLSKWIKSDL
jgi:hypothetical protein